MHLQDRLNIEILIEDPAWCDIWPEVETMSALILKKAAEFISPALSGEVSVALVSDAEIQRLNRTYRDKDGPTNVLSFPIGEEHVIEAEAGDILEARLWGDIVIARETVEAEAAKQHKSVSAHASHLLIHGFLHLFGYDHQRQDEAAQMEALEVNILSELNIDNPYEINEL